MINEGNLIDEIVKYYMNPKKYLNVNKERITEEIKKLDDILLNGSDDTEELLGVLFQKYSSGNLDSEIVKTIHKTRADEQGLSATRGYREIYFNEIIQNANDNTDGDTIDIIISKTENDYEMTFSYKDKGFSVENIIGFFNTEIHTKRDDLSTTGKHGVGIKSLFYFVDYMKIESNVKIEFSIDTKTEDGEEKIIEATSNIEKNDKWYENKDKITYFTIRFPSKKEYGIFKIDKLKKFIDLCYKNSEISDYEINEYYFGFEQTDLIFDTRGLIFTDKNKGKDIGIKKLSFYKGDMGVKLFDISCECLKHFKNDHAKVEFSVIKYNDITKLEYIVFTEEGEEKEQNFSVAFPVELEWSKKRYYETYYLPEADEEGINILINSKYSNVARTKLSDTDNERDRIRTKIDNSLIRIYEFMVDEACAKSELKSEVSRLFHKLLISDTDFKTSCYQNGINNRYLLKYNLEQSTNIDRYIVYARNDREEFEKKLIYQHFSPEAAVVFFEKYILKNDSIRYDENLFLEEVKQAYDKAFSENEQIEWKYVLNLAGTIKELIYYRVVGFFPKQDTFSLGDAEIDNWNENLANEEGGFDKDEIIISLSMIGRYGLNSNITKSGEIKGASFYEYLFNQDENEISNNIKENSLTFRAKQQELYKTQYGELKERMLQLLVNRDKCGSKNCYGYKYDYLKGQVLFFYSTHRNAQNNYFFKDTISIIEKINANGNEVKCIDSDIFGSQLTELLIDKMLSEPELTNHIGYFLESKLMLASKKYPMSNQATINLPDFLPRYVKFDACQLINIDFLRTIYAHSWQRFKKYFIIFFEQSNFKTISDYNFKLLTYKGEKNPLFSIDINNINDIFSFFSCKSIINGDYHYKEEYRFLRGISKYELIIRFDGDIKSENNLCPIDYFNYLQEQIGKKVYVMQTNSINSSTKGILYWQGTDMKIRMLVENSEREIGSGIRSTKDEIIIVYNGKIDYKGAISKVLKDIYKNEDILGRCDAFIPESQHHTIQGEEYDNFISYKNEGNRRNQRIRTIFDSRSLSVKALEKIITARGNNNGKCCCCGKELIKSKLIITNNSNNNTRNEYPLIVEVVCENCWNILNRSHKNTKLVNETGEYFVNYCCDIQNSHQRKEVEFKFKICDGILALCKRK